MIFTYILPFNIMPQLSMFWFADCIIQMVQVAYFKAPNYDDIKRLTVFIFSLQLSISYAPQHRDCRYKLNKRLISQIDYIQEQFCNS